MRNLYEVTLKNRALIVGKAEELCNKDAYIRTSCANEDKIQSILQPLYDVILNSMKNKGYNSTGLSPDASFDSIADSTNTDLIRIMFLKGIDTKPLIAILKHFRSGINAAIFHSFDDKKIMYDYLEDNARYFDSLELSLYKFLEDIKQGEILLNTLGLLDDEKKSIDTIKSLEILKQEAKGSMKLLKEAIEHDKMMSEFYSNLAHELRTPLNVILGTLQLVDMYSSKCSDPIMEKNKKYYRIMRQNCYRLLRLVNNIIDLSKLDVGYMNVNLGNYDVVGIVSKIADSVLDYIQHKGIEFIYSSKIKEKIIACDPDKIERIVLNLLSNSVKFTDVGGKIQVNLWEEDDRIFISVKDNGIGIPKDKHDLVFKRFTQVDKSLSRNHQGSGIGLSLVKSLVELHDGKISLISDAGKGCEFIIELPARQLNIAENPNTDIQYKSNNKIEVIKIEFSDIYSV